MALSPRRRCVRVLLPRAAPLAAQPSIEPPKNRAEFSRFRARRLPSRRVHAENRT